MPRTERKKSESGIYQKTDEPSPCLLASEHRAAISDGYEFYIWDIEGNKKVNIETAANDFAQAIQKGHDELAYTPEYIMTSIFSQSYRQKYDQRVGNIIDMNTKDSEARKEFLTVIRNYAASMDYSNMEALEQMIRDYTTFDTSMW